MLIVLVFLILPLWSGCSTEAPTSGLKVRLRASEQTNLRDLFTILTSSTSPFTSLGQIPCFAVTAYGGAITPTGTCQSATLGSSAGSASGINSTFELSVPLGAGTVTFDAYGAHTTSGGGCQPFDTGIASWIYRLGSTSIDSAPASGFVDIPVALNTSQIYSCESPLALFYSDAFNYSGGNLPSVAAGHWQSGGSNDLQENAGGDRLSLTVAITSEGFLTHFVDTTKPEIDLSITMKNLFPSSPTLKIRVGLASNPTTAPTTGDDFIGCETSITNTGGTAGNFLVGGGSSTFTLSGGSSVGFTGNAPYRMTCKIKRPGTSLITVEGQLTDASGAVVAQRSAASFGGVCISYICKRPYLQGVTGATDTCDLDDFLVEQTP